jgi:hypothetical protein
MDVFLRSVFRRLNRRQMLLLRVLYRGNHGSDLAGHVQLQ